MGLGSGIRDPEKIYSGSRIQESKMHRIPDPQHCSELPRDTRLNDAGVGILELRVLAHQGNVDHLPHVLLPVGELAPAQHKLTRPDGRGEAELQALRENGDNVLTDHL